MKRMALRYEAIGVLVLFAAIGLRADTITLKDGTEIEGIVLEQSSSTVTIQLSTGASRIFRKADIEVLQVDKNRPKAPSPAPVPVALPKPVEIKPAPADVMPPPPAAPLLPRNSALHPTVILKSGVTGGGGTSCFVQVQPGQQPIFLCCQHVFGTAIGLPKDIPSAELEAQVKLIRVEGFGDTRVIGEASGSLVKTGYMINEGIGGEVSAFTVRSNIGVNVLKLAAKDPEPGEWVWLVGDELDHKPQLQRLFPAMVVQTRKGNNGFSDLIMRQAQHIKTTGFSGGPIVNSKMEVVGVYGGRLGIHPDGTYDALWGASASTVREHLERSKK